MAIITLANELSNQCQAQALCPSFINELTINYSIFLVLMSFHCSLPQNPNPDTINPFLSPFT